MKDEIKEILDYLEFLEDIETQNKVKKVKDYITNLQEENENLKDFNNKLQATKDRLDKYDRENTMLIENYKLRIEKARKDIQHELLHLKANDEVSWNKEFYTNDKLDYRKLCIALLEQFVNKLKDKE